MWLMSNDNENYFKSNWLAIKNSDEGYVIYDMNTNIVVSMTYATKEEARDRLWLFAHNTPDPCFFQKKST